MGMPNEKKILEIAKAMESVEGTLAPSPNAAPIEKFRFSLQQEIARYKRINDLSGTELAEEHGMNLYSVMYALYEANPDAFTDGNIHAMKADNVLILDESMMNSVSTDYAYNEVSRHIYCRC